MYYNSYRKMQIIGEINSESYKEFAEALTLLEDENHDPIEIELYSEGGGAEIALSYASRIRNSPCKVHIRSHGNVESAAVIILASGKFRSMSADGWIMVHEDTGELSGSVTELEKQVRRLRQLENQWAVLLERYTGTDAKIWTDLHKNTTYLTSQQGMELHLVDEVF